MSKNPEHGRDSLSAGRTAGSPPRQPAPAFAPDFSLTKVNEARTRTLKMNWTVAVERKRSSKEPPCPDLLNTAPVPRYVPRCLPGAAEADPVSHGRGLSAHGHRRHRSRRQICPESGIARRREKDISVEIDGATVMILANKEQSSEVKDEGKVLRKERYWGQIQRSVTLASPIDSAAARAVCENGVLVLTLPKKRAATAGCCRSSRSCKGWTRPAPPALAHGGRRPGTRRAS